MLVLVKKARSATQGDTSMEWLKPFMTERKYRKGDVLFKKDEVADEMFMTLTGTKLIHVPYKGNTSGVLTDVIAGHVDLSFIQFSAVHELARSAKARVLAVATNKRLESLPDAPTMAEAGFPEVVSETWNAISAPWSHRWSTPAPVCRP